MNPHFDPDKPHHTREGFQNTGEPFPIRSLAEVLRWRREASQGGHPRPPREPIPRVAPDLALLRRPQRPDGSPAAIVTWVGHATVLVQCAGLAVLTDPMFSERASPLSFAGPRRHVPPGVAMADLPRIDVVAVSHNHYDHLDVASLRALGRQAGGPPLVVVPLGLKSWLEVRGISNVVELDWWQSHRPTDMPSAAEVVLVPARHWSGRGLRDRLTTLWGGFAVFFGDDAFQLFFAGDTGYSRDFVDARQHFAPRQGVEQGGGFDLALLPIGAYAPRWFMGPQHIDVDEALQIHQDLGAKRSLGVHWGTFALSDEPLDEPPRLLAQRRVPLGLGEEDFGVCAIGQSLILPCRRA